MRSALIILSCLVAFVSQAEAQAVKPAISESEFLRLLNEGKEITEYTVKAELIIKALARGKGVTVKQCLIEGDLFFQNKEALHLNIIDTVVNGKIGFEGTTFKDHMTFSGSTTFNDEVTFDSVTFNGVFFIYGEVVFNKWFQAYGCKFSDLLRFDNVSFKNGASFTASIFNERASFIATKTWGRASYFERATFMGPAEFNGIFFTATQNSVKQSSKATLTLVTPDSLEMRLTFLARNSQDWRFSPTRSFGGNSILPA